MLTIYIDFKSPGSYLALRPTLAMARRQGVTLDWQPYLVQERDIPQVTQDETVALRHHRVRLESVRATHKAYAALADLDLSYPEQPGETDLALAALAVISGDKTGFVESAFGAYWQSQVDLNNKACVEDLLRTAGYVLDLSALPVRATLDEAQRQAESQDVVDAPCYLIDGQVFVGRQHIPWIEELLSKARA